MNKNVGNNNNLLNKSLKDNKSNKNRALTKDELQIEEIKNQNEIRKNVFEIIEKK